MMSFDTGATIVGALNLPLEPRLHRLLTNRVEQCRSAGVLDMTDILIIEAGDTEKAIIEEVGFSPLVNPMDGARYGSVRFHPYWDGPIWRHDGWFQMVVTVGNSGFAFLLFIQDAEGTFPELLALCRFYAEPTS